MKRKLLFYTIYVVFIVLLFEFAFRAFYAVSFQKTNILWRPFALMEHYYPGFLEIYDREIAAHNDTIDVLLLGGSVLTPMWGDVEDSLEVVFKEKAVQPVNIYNAAYAAHSSRDSRLKYELLKDQHFDVVVVYHGINETRFNHCPAEMFKTDYDHVDFYAKVNRILDKKWSRFTVLPLVFIQLKTNILKGYAEEKYMPLHAPVKDSHKDWLAYGMEVKTKASFHENYAQILQLAKQRGAKVVMPEFAYYIPENYTLEKFENKKLDYARHRNPVELWGTVATVSAGIEGHNAVVRQIVEDKGIETFNANQTVPKNKKMFDDLCHFTPTGSGVFAHALAQSIFMVAENE